MANGNCMKTAGIVQAPCDPEQEKTSTDNGWMDVPHVAACFVVM